VAVDIDETDCRKNWNLWLSWEIAGMFGWEVNVTLLGV